MNSVFDLNEIVQVDAIYIWRCYTNFSSKYEGLISNRECSVSETGCL